MQDLLKHRHPILSTKYVFISKYPTIIMQIVDATNQIHLLIY